MSKNPPFAAEIAATAMAVANAKATAEVDASSQAMNLDQLFTRCGELQASAQPHQALEVYQHWLATSNDPLRYMAWYNYGSLLQSVGQSEDAVKAYGQCLQLQTRFPQALINLGLTLEKLGRREEALQQWAALVSHRLLKDAPETEMLVLALNHIGRVQEDLKQYDLAEQALEQSLALKPKQPGVLQHWVHIRQKSCSWPVYKSLPNITHNDMLMATSPLAMLALTDDPVQQLLTAFAFVERTYGFKQEFLSRGREYRHERTRIGYVSGDMCVHAVGLLLPQLLEGHDRNQFEVFGYDFSPEDGTAHRERVKKAFDHLRPIHSWTDQQVAQQVLNDEIDVLIDLHGLSSGARPGIFALHPAPKQGTYLGFIGTTGMPWFDFVIADSYVITEESSKYFTEKPLLLETSFIPESAHAPSASPLRREDFGLKPEQFVMAAFGNVYKINEALFDCWTQSLRRVENAVLWLIDDNPATTRELKRQARIRRIDPQRIIFTPRATLAEYLARMKLADLFLDSFPYNCGSTTRDVLNAGVPIVTMSGKTMVSRMTGSMLSALGLQELITTSPNEYTQLIIKLATHTEFQKQLKEKLNPTPHPKLHKLSLSQSLEKQLKSVIQ
ncbi:acetylglucosamine transferase [Limnohabitans sp.]|uniref:O-linked N-acetylglucosamine transferase, SPINDLY family protein n=1 Tax=Limnohabitans sp. TaxID=1907725 RepID=UPI0038BD8A0E